ncbi:hypothetical protein [Rheinheimera baltica]|uniref:hypothetical protein n=1 Tax=Rheinheimera baltica TaxID=67576 RepID=UPI00040EAACB|nr:hypothetical protein [Rheinheimera baltica]
MHSRLRLLAFALSLLLLAAALGMMWYARQFEPQQAQLLVRPLDVAMLPLPPPPPPPSPPQPVTHAAALDVKISHSAAVKIPTHQIKVPQPKLSINAPQPQIEQLQWQSLDLQITAFSLAQLDTLPVLQTPLNVTFPRSLTRQGVTNVLVKLDILINEQGRLTLLDVLENPYPELRPEIERLVRNSRFSMPTKGNAAVSARFIWPIEFKP